MAGPPCPSCGSDLPEALRWVQRPDGDLDLRMRCPECHSCFAAIRTPAEMRALDCCRHEARETIVLAYERMVGESMEALASCLHAALARDLVGADDFAVRPRRGSESRTT